MSLNFRLLEGRESAGESEDDSQEGSGEDLTMEQEEEEEEEEAEASDEPFERNRKGIRGLNVLRPSAVKTFWDLDTAAIPEGDLTTLSFTIDKALKNFDKKLYIAGRIYCFGTPADPIEERVKCQRLTSLGKCGRDFTVKLFEPRLKTCGDASCDYSQRTPKAKSKLAEIEASMLIGDYAVRQDIKRNPESKIMIISSDPEFAVFYPKLSNLGFTVFFATCCEHPEQINEFGNPVDLSRVWLWPTMYKGGRPMK